MSKDKSKLKKLRNKTTNQGNSVNSERNLITDHCKVPARKETIYVEREINSEELRGESEE